MFMNADGGKIGRKEKTYILDEKEAGERKAKQFNIFKHNQDVAQYRVAHLMQQKGEELTLESVARSKHGKKLYTALLLLQARLSAGGNSEKTKLKSNFMQIYKEHKNEECAKMGHVQLFT
jgi:hypothetical protein